MPVVLERQDFHLTVLSKVFNSLAFPDHHYSDANNKITFLNISFHER